MHCVCTVSKNEWSITTPPLSLSFTPHPSCYFSKVVFFLPWCLCGACHTPTPQQRRLLLASSSVSSVSKFSRAATHPAPAQTSPARRTTTVRWWRWPSRKPSRPTCPTATAPTAASTAEHTWPTTMNSSQRWANGFGHVRKRALMIMYTLSVPLFYRLRGKPQARRDINVHVLTLGW